MFFKCISLTLLLCVIHSLVILPAIFSFFDRLLYRTEYPGRGYEYMRYVRICKIWDHFYKKNFDLKAVMKIFLVLLSSIHFAFSEETLSDFYEIAKEDIISYLTDLENQRMMIYITDGLGHGIVDTL